MMLLMNRPFLIAVALACAATALAQFSNQTITGKSRVVLVRDATVMPALEADAGKVRAMVASGIKTLTGLNDEAAAWGTFVSSNDIVGIKVTTTAAPLQATRPAVVDAIAAGLRSAGVAATNIIVWDRDATKMRDAGFVEQPGSYRVLPTVPDGGWDADLYVEGHQVGKLMWGDLLFGTEGNALSTRSHFPKVLTQRITKLINVPVLQDSEACGIAGCLYNLSLGTVDNVRRFETQDRIGDPVIPEVVKLPLVRGKLVLNVMDALVGSYAGGPAFKPHYSWHAGALYFSRDPVAIDSLCLELIKEKRRDNKVPPLGDRIAHVLRATLMGIGLSSTNEIDLIERTP